MVPETHLVTLGSFWGATEAIIFIVREKGQILMCPARACGRVRDAWRARFLITDAMLAMQIIDVR